MPKELGLLVMTQTADWMCACRLLKEKEIHSEIKFWQQQFDPH